MKYFTFVLLLIILGACNRDISTHDNQYSFPFLGEMVDSYYFSHFEYPDSLNEFINYILLYEGQDSIGDITIQKIIKSKNNINWSISDSSLTISYLESEIFYTYLRSPCNELHFNASVYAHKYLFFNNTGIQINSNDIEDSFRSILVEIRGKYNNGIVKEDRYPTFIVLEFNSPDSLTSFCGDNEMIKKYPYLMDHEKALSEFAEKNKISKIIFTTAIRY